MPVTADSRRDRGNVSPVGMAHVRQRHPIDLAVRGERQLVQDVHGRGDQIGREHENSPAGTVPVDRRQIGGQPILLGHRYRPAHHGDGQPERLAPRSEVVAKRTRHGQRPYRNPAGRAQRRS
jgi:hypothetical protein